MDEHAAPPPRPSSSRRRQGIVVLALVAVVALVGAVVGTGFVWVTEASHPSATAPAVAAATAPAPTDAACVATEVAMNVLPSVVTVETATGQGAGNGSGELIRPGGYVLTNYHVVGSAAAASNGTIDVRYSDSSLSPAKVVGLDPTTDLAVIRADDGAPGRPVIQLGSSANLRIGEPVVVLGAPLGLSATVTHGIVSALERYIPLGIGAGRTAHLIDAIQSDASINPGNSGGAMVDCAGRLIGVPSAIISLSGGSNGLGFAIPVDLADPVAQALITTGHANHPRFGLQLTAVVGRDGTSVGLFVNGVDPGGPAAQAGIRAGDLITTVNGEPSTTIAQLEKIALTHQAGDRIPVSFTRNGAPNDTTITLATPTPPSQ
jgi:putative serine protease PepD